MAEASLRDQIVTAALELFREKGYHATSLQDIILAADCSKGGFYHHFSSKEDLLCLIHETFIEHELAAGEAVRIGPDTPGQKLKRLMVDLVVSIDIFRPHVTVFFEERRFLSSDKFGLVKQKRDRYEQIVRDLIAEGIKSGEFRADLDLNVVTFSIFGMCNWTYQWMRSDGKLSPEQVGEIMSELVLQGLRATPGPAAADVPNTRLTPRGS